ncbi:MAG: NnrU family protein [Myxococcales bacterium]|nr:NnrU family protein [Myxococcales bacterium]
MPGSTSLHIELTLSVLAFALWSSLWPRAAIKGRLEPKLGFRAYRIFYNIGTIALFCTSFAFLAQHSDQTPRLWDLRGYPWFRPLIYFIEGLGVFFLSASVQLGLSFWGLADPPPDRGLQTGGFYKITRHPLYWSVFCLLFGHLLVFGSTLALLYFVLMELYNVVGVIAFENRALAARFGRALDDFHRQSSTIPFWSLIRGRVSLGRNDLPRFAIAGSVVFTFLVAWLHDLVLVRLMHELPTLASLGGALP